MLTSPRPFATVSTRYSTADVERFYATGQWRHDTLFDVLERQVADRGDKVFFTDSTTSYTFRQLRDDSLRLAVGLVRSGIRPGDRVVVQIPNWAEFAVVLTALSRIGAVTVPVMPIYRRGEVGHVVESTGAKMAITCGVFRGWDHAAMFLDLQQRHPDLADVVVLRSADRVAGTVLLGDLLVDIDPESAAAEIGPGVGPDDHFVIVFSSGTTSRAKGCLHTFNTMACGARLLGGGFGYSDADVQFGPSPVTHTTGLVTSVLLPLIFGAGSHIMEVWEPVAALERIARFGCTASVTATTFLQMLIAAFDPAVHDASSLRLWTAAGSAIPGSFVSKARSVLPGMQVLSLYGRTENITTTMCTTVDDPARSITSDGAALEFQEVRIVGPDGGELPRGQEGDICYRGAMHMLEYINQPEETAELFTPDGFSRSGDLGVMDADGYVRVTGRIKDIVIRGGLNISVRQVEDLLSGHPGVAGVAVVGMPDETMGERVCCYLVPAPGAVPLTLEDIRTFLMADGLAIQKVPERLEIVTALPTTPTGKIQKNLLRADIAGKLRQ